MGRLDTLATSTTSPSTSSTGTRSSSSAEEFHHHHHDHSGSMGGKKERKRLQKSSSDVRGMMMDLSDLKMSLHTEQQSIIWNEMASMKQKLEEENQMLRDQIQDAQVTINKLQMRLAKKQAKATKSSQNLTQGGKSSSWFGFKSSKYDKAPTLPVASSKTTKKKSSKKNAFENHNAPGKKTFNHVQLQDGTPGMIVFPKNGSHPRVQRQDSMISMDPALLRPIPEDEPTGEGDYYNGHYKDYHVASRKKTASTKVLPPSSSKVNRQTKNKKPKQTRPENSASESQSSSSSTSTTLSPPLSPEPSSSRLHPNNSVIDTLAQTLIQEYTLPDERVDDSFSDSQSTTPSYWYVDDESEQDYINVGSSHR